MTCNTTFTQPISHPLPLHHHVFKSNSTNKCKTVVPLFWLSQLKKHRRSTLLWSNCAKPNQTKRKTITNIRNFKSNHLHDGISFVQQRYCSVFVSLSLRVQHETYHSIARACASRVHLSLPVIRVCCRNTYAFIRYSMTYVLLHIVYLARAMREYVKPLQSLERSTEVLFNYCSARVCIYYALHMLCVVRV